MTTPRSRLPALLLLALSPLALALADRGEPEAAAPRNPGAMVTPEEVEWRPGPPKLPPGALVAVLEGDPSKPGLPYTFRAKLPDGYSVPPHWHPMDEHITVIRGTILLGMGTEFDPAKLRELPAGSYARLPQNEPHFNRYRGETVIQLHGIGPYDIQYVDPADDPTNKPTP